MGCVPADAFGVMHGDGFKEDSSCFVVPVPVCVELGHGWKSAFINDVSVGQVGGI